MDAWGVGQEVWTPPSGNQGPRLPPRHAYGDTPLGSGLRGRVAAPPPPIPPRFALHPLPAASPTAETRPAPRPRTCVTARKPRRINHDHAFKRFEPGTAHCAVPAHLCLVTAHAPSHQPRSRLGAFGSFGSEVRLSATLLFFQFHDACRFRKVGPELSRRSFPVCNVRDGIPGELIFPMIHESIELRTRAQELPPWTNALFRRLDTGFKASQCCIQKPFDPLNESAGVGHDPLLQLPRIALHPDWMCGDDSFPLGLDDYLHRSVSYPAERLVPSKAGRNSLLWIAHRVVGDPLHTFNDLCISQPAGEFRLPWSPSPGAMSTTRRRSAGAHGGARRGGPAGGPAARRGTTSAG